MQNLTRVFVFGLSRLLHLPARRTRSRANLTARAICASRPAATTAPALSAAGQGVLVPGHHPFRPVLRSPPPFPPPLRPTPPTYNADAPLVCPARGTRGAFSVCGYGLRYASTAGVAPVWATVALAFHKVGGVRWWFWLGVVCRLQCGRCASDPPTRVAKRGSVRSLRGGL